MTYKLRLDVEPGTKIADASLQAQRLADDCGENVEFEFNSVDCVAVPGGDHQLLAERQQVASKSRFRVTSSEED